jgi:alkylation response protein AidB-like acyl-CoA dehydrogenase
MHLASAPSSTHTPTQPTAHDGAELLELLSKARITIRNAAAPIDSPDVFPSEAVEQLRNLGVLRAPLPPHDGGLGWGTVMACIPALGAALQILGNASLSVGRIYEAHVNALTLIDRFADVSLRETCSSAVQGGHLFALWVAPSAEPVRLLQAGPTLRLAGTKAFCTAAGHATRAVVTVVDERDLERMVVVDSTHAGITCDPTPQMHGMKNTSTKRVRFDLEISRTQLLGDAGDYLREPEFSVGAWRTSAVTAGGLRALVDETIRQLRSRMRHTDPHQSARIGDMLIKSETTALWATAVAQCIATPSLHEQDVMSFVNLGRAAIEQACMDVIPLVQ